MQIKIQKSYNNNDTTNIKIICPTVSITKVTNTNLLSNFLKINITYERIKTENYNYNPIYPLHTPHFELFSKN